MSWSFSNAAVVDVLLSVLQSAHDASSARDLRKSWHATNAGVGHGHAIAGCRGTARKSTWDIWIELKSTTVQLETTRAVTEATHITIEAPNIRDSGSLRNLRRDLEHPTETQV